ncbi:unnamed protein product [Schistocephalus solidus]|uniref:Uncharacterized protein n=1 Tax=Schistocephalus solidus TaxID=70667 RepID=A0A183SXX1_SCHSO|nr:unnamed protein product [Schistocephalus solidus]
MVYDDYDLWEDRMNVSLEAVDEVTHPAAVLGRLCNEVYTVSRAANLTASLTPTTIFDRLRREFGRSSMPWVDHAPSKVADNTRPLSFTKLLPPYSRCLRHGTATEPRHLHPNGSMAVGALLSPLLLGVVLLNPKILGAALQS